MELVDEIVDRKTDHARRGTVRSFFTIGDISPNLPKWVNADPIFGEAMLSMPSSVAARQGNTVSGNSIRTVIQLDVARKDVEICRQRFKRQNSNARSRRL